SANDKPANRDGAQCNGPNRQRAERESRHALRSDCQCADAHSRQIIWFCLVHVAVTIGELDPWNSILRPDLVGRRNSVILIGQVGANRTPPTGSLPGKLALL